MLKHFKKFQKENEKEKEKNIPIKITDLYEYKKELKKGTTDFDFSELNMNFQDIQNINLEGLNLDINLREIFVPYNGSHKMAYNILTPTVSSYTGDHYLKINNSRLGGNKVTGNLMQFKGSLRYKPVYFWYSEETFDNEYKSKYPEFFISKEAPDELRQKYYNPQMIYNKTNDVKELFRQSLTLDEYLNYYEFLKGKYLGNFMISKEDLMQIELIEKYGLDQGNIILNDIKKIINDLNRSSDFEDLSINEVDDIGISLTLKLKFKK